MRLAGEILQIPCSGLCKLQMWMAAQSSMTNALMGENMLVQNGHARVENPCFKNTSVLGTCFSIDRQRVGAF